MADIFYISMPHMSIDLQTSFYRTVYDLLMYLFACRFVWHLFVPVRTHWKTNTKNAMKEIQLSLGPAIRVPVTALNTV